jgi:hypothetical protein
MIGFDIYRAGHEYWAVPISASHGGGSPCAEALSARGMSPVDHCCRHNIGDLPPTWRGKPLLLASINGDGVLGVFAPHWRKV